MQFYSVVLQPTLVFTLLLFLDNGITVNSLNVPSERTTLCAFYNQTQCLESREHGQGQGCLDKEECVSQGDGKRSHCYVVWRKDQNGNMNITLKGCFLDNESCYNKTQCIDRAHKPKKDYLFCCCEGNMCNQNFTWDPMPTESTPVKAVEPVPDHSNMYIHVWVTMGSLGMFIIVGFIIFYLYKRNKPMFNEWGIPTMDSSLNPPPSPYMDKRPIQLIDIKARGRFGSVWKALYKGEEIAVKIFPLQDKQSWCSESEIYKLPYMEHPNILEYIGAEKRDNLSAEFWLITAYHERGSLCDFLKAHIITWSELCRIAESMTSGLMHLHEDIHNKSPDQVVKPAVAHRDFKSKNVLLKNDMTACIADFGLAQIFYSGKSCGDTHGQVGTRRYMAPEVLEGAINFTPDAFLRIDMYACGLVLWEIVSRCTAQDGPIPEYRLPFEEEVGQHPTLEDMQESVVQRKVRPTIPQSWRNHPGLSIICDTMEDCWDHDAEARLSASCVKERIMRLRKFQQSSFGMRIENDSPVKDNSIFIEGF